MVRHIERSLPGLIGTKRLVLLKILRFQGQIVSARWAFDRGDEVELRQRCSVHHCWNIRPESLRLLCTSGASLHCIGG